MLASVVGEMRIQGISGLELEAHRTTGILQETSHC